MVNYIHYFKGYGNYGLHLHIKDELIIIRNGNFTVSTEKETFTQKAPCCILYKKNKIHIQQNSNIGLYERYCIHFDKKNVIDSQVYNDLYVLPPSDAICISLTEETLEPIWNTAKIMNSIKDESKTNDNRYKLLLNYILNELSIIYADYCATHKISNISEPYLTNIMQYIISNLNEKLTIDSVAEKFGVGRTKLITDFRKCLSSSFSEYVTVIRLNKACELLSQGKKTSEIAEICGFRDASYFVKVFSKYYNTTPEKYRKTYLKKLP